MDKEFYFQQFSNAIFLGGNFLKCWETREKGRRLTKRFIVFIVTHLGFMSLMGIFIYLNFTDMSFSHVTEIAAVSFAALQSFAGVVILLLKNSTWTALSQEVIDGRKAVAKNDPEWHLTLKYCKDEFVAGIIAVALFGLFSLLAVTINFMCYNNEFQLPFNFCFGSLARDWFGITWLLNYICQVVLAAPIGACFTIFCPFSLVLMDNTCMRLDVAILMAKRLDQTLDNGFLKKAEITRQLKIIIDTHNQTMDWIEKVRDLMKFYFLVEFTNLSLMLCTCAYTLSVNASSMICLVGLTMFLAQLFIYCLMGTRATNKIENFVAALYDTKWYLMDVGQQKQLQLILVTAQNMKGFDGIFSAVDMETFQKVLDFSYSVFTLLRSTN